MKKTLALSLILTLVFTVICPWQVLAAYDKDLEKAITTAKTLLAIPKGYDNFSYNINKQSTSTIFDLNWSDSKNKLGSLNVSINTKGKIINYYVNKPYIARSQKRLPVISQNDAIKLAQKFVNRVNPAINGKLQYQENSYPMDLNNTTYWLNFIRVENGIPFPENSVSVAIDKLTGEVQNYSLNWYDELVFPKADKSLSLLEAQQIYWQKLGLKLIYKQTYDPKAAKPYLVYTNVYYNSYLDAQTGEVIAADSYYGFNTEKAMGGDGMRNTADAKPQNLTPQEQEAVKSAADLLDQTQAEETARKALNLDKSYKVNYINLYKNWQSPDEYSWSVDFSIPTKDASSPTFGASITLDAKTGTIQSFYRGVPYDASLKVKYTEAQALVIAQDLIKQMQPEEAKQVEQTIWNRQVIRPLLAGAELPRETAFEFTRITNGAYYPDNGFRVTVDNTTGRVISYSFSWYQKELPSTAKVLSDAQAQKLFYSNLGIQLQYLSQPAPEQINGDESSKILPRPTYEGKRDVMLVYAIKPGKPTNLDALTGKILNENGKPYVKQGSNQYTDLKGNFAEAKIKVLAEFGIALPGAQLKPNQSITQREFLFLLAKATNPYLEYDWTDSKADDALYNQLTEAGIIKEGERLPKSILTKQQAVKFLVRALNYEKVAEIQKGIYRLPFKDAKLIPANQVGYLAIAYGLNLVEGDRGYIKAQQALNRAEAFVLIYRFLNI